MDPVLHEDLPLPLYESQLLYVIYTDHHCQKLGQLDMSLSTGGITLPLTGSGQSGYLSELCLQGWVCNQPAVMITDTWITESPPPGCTVKGQLC